ncbi:acyltransferase [bacterium]|nr:acyltransferase [bacterium]
MIAENSEPKVIKGKYRPEIDGLRAFAVVSVIVNHFNKDLLPGGYLGVDIFFVISGYVITSSLFGRNSKDFKDFIIGFYERRIKRLIPALAAFVVLTAIAAHLLIQNAGTFYITGALSLFGVSNLYIMSQVGGYWGFNASINPFTQTWSLGVEEQFYLLFPFLIWFTGFGRQTKNGARNLFLVLGALAVLSLINFLYLYPSNQSAAYFLMPFRFWEMATGCLIFIGFQKRAPVEQFLEKVPPLLVVGIIVGVMYLPLSWGEASTVAVVVLTSALIACLKNQTAAFNIFTSPKIVYVGLISYSLYLWHWGILVLARWSIGITKVTVIPLLVLIFCMAVLSYEAIEKNTRRSAWSSRRFLTIGKGLLIALGAASLSILLGTKLRARFYLGENRSTNPPQNIAPSSKFYLIGDSHANDIYNLLLNNGSFDVIDYTIGGCRFYFDKSPKCSKHSENASMLVSNVNPGDVVIFASNYLPKILEDEDDIDLMIKYFGSMLPSLLDKDVTVVLKLPHPEANAPKVGEGLMCKKEIFRPIIDKGCLVDGVPKKKHMIRSNEAMKPLFDFVKGSYPDVLYWDISNITCPDDQCFPVTREKQYLQDSSHLFLTSATLSDDLVRDLNKLLRNIY